MGSNGGYTSRMETLNFIYWKNDQWWIGYLEEFPDYQTQGASLDELKESLKDLYKDLSSGEIPGIRKLAKLEVG